MVFRIQSRRPWFLFQNPNPKQHHSSHWPQNPNLLLRHGLLPPPLRPPPPPPPLQPPPRGLLHGRGRGAHRRPQAPHRLRPLHLRPVGPAVPSAPLRPRLAPRRRSVLPHPGRGRRALVPPTPPTGHPTTTHRHPQLRRGPRRRRGGCRRHGRRQAGRGGREDRVRAAAGRLRSGEQDQGDQGDPDVHGPRAEGGQGARGEGARRDQGRIVQGGSPGDRRADEGHWCQGRHGLIGMSIPRLNVLTICLQG